MTEIQKLICKKSFIKFRYGREIFIKNNTYDIVEIDCYQNYLIISSPGHGRWFTNNKYSHYDNIYEYFYSPDEMRLLKLNSSLGSVQAKINCFLLILKIYQFLN